MEALLSRAATLEAQLERPEYLNVTLAEENRDHEEARKWSETHTHTLRADNQRLQANIQGMAKERDDVLAQLEATRAHAAHLEQRQAAMEAEIKQAAERYARMEGELTSARLQIQQFRSEGQQFANDVAQAVDAGRVEVASEIARANERASCLEERYQALKAEMDATVVNTAQETAALKVTAQG